MSSKSIKTPLQHTVTLKHRNESAGSVFVAGSFNGWDPTSHPFERDGNGVWQITLELDREDHEYKFVVDGRWRHDELNPEFVINAFGTINSIFPDA